MWNDYDPYMMMGNSKKAKNIEVSLDLDFREGES